MTEGEQRLVTLLREGRAIVKEMDDGCVESARYEAWIKASGRELSRWPAKRKRPVTVNESEKR